MSASIEDFLDAQPDPLLDTTVCTEVHVGSCERCQAETVPEADPWKA